VEEVYASLITEDKTFPIWGKGSGIECAIALQVGNLAPTRYFPQAQRVIFRAGDDVAAIGQEGNGSHVLCMPLKAGNLALARHLPKPQRLVP